MKWEYEAQFQFFSPKLIRCHDQKRTRIVFALKNCCICGQMSREQHCTVTKTQYVFGWAQPFGTLYTPEVVFIRKLAELQWDFIIIPAKAVCWSCNDLCVVSMGSSRAQGYKYRKWQNR